MLRSIDVQQVLSQSSLVEKVQDVKQHHPDMEHRHFSLETQRTSRQKQEEVQHSEKTEGARINEEERKERERKKRELKTGKKKKGGERSGEKFLEPGQKKHIDVII